MCLKKAVFEMLSCQMQTSQGEVIITNDGATILKQMSVNHPAAKMVRLLHVGTNYYIVLTFFMARWSNSRSRRISKLEMERQVSLSLRGPF
jgi:hypothetical protein